MAHIEIDKREFDELVGEEITEEKLEEEASFLGAHWNHIEGPKWDVEVYPNRPDLLSVEGLARAYRGFFDIEKGLTEYSTQKGDIKVEVDSSVKYVRPYIGGAVIRGLELSEKKINGLIQLQEKLHQTVGRRRDKIAIGLHDMSELEPPFTYKAVKPEEASFTPLEHDQNIDLQEILENHEKGQKYNWILEDESEYPIIVDSNDQVLSFPPIINNQLTEVTSGTEDIFIDVTGKDRETVQTVLNILVTALAEREGSIETVNVDGKEMPDLSSKSMDLDVDYFKSISGLDLSEEKIVDRLQKMKYSAEAKDEIGVSVPSYRADLMHQYDLIEDIVIAHGYRNIEPEIPEIDQIANETGEEQFTDMLRDVIQGAGAMEAHTYILSSEEKLIDKMEIESEEIIKMSNSLTEEYSAVRNWLLPSLMGALNRNRQHSYPQKFFEVADTAHLAETVTGAENRKKLAYVEAGNDVGYTNARKVIQVVERELDIDFEIAEASKNCFKVNRSAEVILNGNKIGVIGEFSETVTSNWGLDVNAVGFELDVKKLRELE